MLGKCRYNPCTCTSDEKWVCLSDQYNEFDRVDDELKLKKINEQFIKAVEDGDIIKAKKLLHKVSFKDF